MNHFSKKTISISVTFNPDVTVLERQLVSLSRQCRSIIVDNGSDLHTRQYLSAQWQNNDNVTLIWLENNIGISAAQNIGIKYIQKNFPTTEYVLLLDHDSNPPDSMIRNLEDYSLEFVKSNVKLAAIGPLLFDPRDQKSIGFHIIQSGIWKKIVPEPDAPPIECDSLNSSGSLITMKALETVGLLHSGFFMDHGETEWCFRAKSQGYGVFGVTAVRMEHYMGDDVVEYWLFGKRRMPYRSPGRHYYIVRNSLLMYKMSYVPLTWKFWNILKLLFTLGYFGLFSHEASEQRSKIILGIRHGLKGKTGKLDLN